MAQKDPFTLDLFSNTSISSGLGLGVAAFPTTVEADDTDHPQSSLVLEHFPIWRNRKGIPLRGQIMIHAEGW